MKYQATKTEEFLASARETIEAAAYRPEMMKSLPQGKNLLERAQRAYQTYRDLRRQRHQAVRTMEVAWEEADLIYMSHRQHARMVFKHDFVHQRLLGLDVLNRQTFSGWMAQARNFYARLQENTELLDMMMKEDVFAVADVEKVVALLSQASEASMAQEQLQAQEQLAAVELDSTLSQLNDWVAAAKRIPQIAIPMPIPVEIRQLEHAL
jgi:hypothetical protein